MKLKSFKLMKQGYSQVVYGHVCLPSSGVGPGCGDAGVVVCLPVGGLGLAGTVIKAPASQAREGRALRPFLARPAERVHLWSSFGHWQAAGFLLPRDGGKISR
jgi:hypothetical protein